MSPGVVPEGNAFFDGFEVARRLRRRGLGDALASLSDGTLLEIVQSCSTSTLCALCCVSRGIRCFASFEDLWRERFLETMGSVFEWHGTWKATLLKTTPFEISGAALYSDLLYQPQRIVSARRLVARGSVETVRRVTSAIFDESRPAVFEKAFEPPKSLLNFDKDVRCHVGGYDMRIRDFLKYANHNNDDRPLLLFDKTFLDDDENKMKIDSFSLNDFVASQFSEDFFELFTGDWRPDHRWLIAGGPGSGSTWHVDPNGTNAWNACLSGRKRWFFSPTPPEGVYPSSDGLDVAAPVSVTDWYLAFYGTAKKHLLECNVGPGDLVYVPSGWWHAVANDDETLTVAITQNFCSKSSLAKTLKLLRDQPHLVSGLRRPRTDDKKKLGSQFFQRFVELLQRHHPALLQEVLQKLDKPTNLWQRIIHHKEEEATTNERTAKAPRLLQTKDQKSPTTTQEDSSFAFRFF